MLAVAVCLYVLSHLLMLVYSLKFQKTGNGMQEEVETSACDAVTGVFLYF